MKNISLLKVTVFVASAVLISNFVHANNDNEKVTPVSSENVELFAPSEPSFFELTKVLDSDQNNMLSKEEVSKSENKQLSQMFNSMDLNEDNQLEDSEYELFINTTDKIKPSLQ